MPTYKSDLIYVHRVLGEVQHTIASLISTPNGTYGAPLKVNVIRRAEMAKARDLLVKLLDDCKEDGY